MRDFVSNHDPSFFLKQKQTKWIQIDHIYDRERYLLNHIYITASKRPRRYRNIQSAQSLWALDSSLELPCISCCFPFPLTVQIHGIPLNFVKKFNLISKYFLESGLSGIWRLNLHPAGSLRMLGQNSSELRNQETKGFVFFPISKIPWLCRTFYKTLLMFSIPFYQKVAFTDGTRSLDWGISSLLIILGKSAGKLPRLSRLTISSLTTVTIGFPAAIYF